VRARQDDALSRDEFIELVQHHAIAEHVLAAGPWRPHDDDDGAYVHTIARRLPLIARHLPLIARMRLVNVIVGGCRCGCARGFRSYRGHRGRCAYAAASAARVSASSQPRRSVPSGDPRAAESAGSSATCPRVSIIPPGTARAFASQRRNAAFHELARQFHRTQSAAPGRNVQQAHAPDFLTRPLNSPSIG
jgi:hypothetical protein